MKLIILVVALISASAFAGESCEVLKKVDGKLTFVTVPCATMKTEQLVKDEESARKRKCGKDYAAIRVGMKIDRLQECSGGAYVTKTVSKDGVIEKYQTTFDMVDVKNGRIVSYTKRRY